LSEGTAAGSIQLPGAAGPYLAMKATAVWYGTQFIRPTRLEPMIARGWGRIINIASIIGQTGAFGQANYAAAKTGVIAFTKSVAQEVAKYGVTVNAFCPGFVDTDMVASMPPAAKEAVKGRIPLGRFGDADEVGSPGAVPLHRGRLDHRRPADINGGQFM